MPFRKAQHEQLQQALRRIGRALDQRSRVLLRGTGLSTPQALVLQALARHGPQSVSELAEAVSASQATVTDILDRLGGRGLISRRRHARDKRRVEVSLTAAGGELARSAPPLLPEAFQAAFAALPDWEQSQMIATLQRVAAMLAGPAQGGAENEPERKENEASQCAE